ncbi:hypothetical protein CVT24_007873, partial [Panaeolus cyanescens]
MVSGGPSKGKGAKGKKGVVCWNCGQKGHYKNKCTNPAKDDDKKSKKDNSPKKGSANAAENDSDSDQALAADIESDGTDSEDDNSSMPGLATVSYASEEEELDSRGDDDEDWFSEVGEDAGVMDDEG